MRFNKHYTRDEARQLLPQLREWLLRLNQLRRQLEETDEHLGKRLQAGWDIGGPAANRWARGLGELRGILAELERRDIQVKDLERGLIDFPAVIDEREVFLCWEMGEEDIAFYHDLDAGYSGRVPL